MFVNGFLKLIEAGQPYDKGAYEACLKSSIEEVVRHEVAVVPEPATVMLLGTGIAGLGLFGIRRRNATQA
mgnify:CR=1 FL=1